MRSKILFLVALLVKSDGVFSQQALLNPELYRAVTNEDVSSQMISLLAQGDVNVIEQSVKQLGGVFKYSVSNIAAVNLPMNEVLTLANVSGIHRIEGLQGTGQTLDDKTNINADVNPVQLGYAPLTQPFTGSGVVMGLLDVGIEINHPDFQHEDGTTRIRWLWDQTMSTGGTTPPDYGYGQEWDSTAINAGQCTHTEPYNEFGHGSNVSGIASGNGLAVNNFIGVAPKTDIVTVAVSFDQNFLNNVVDATKYVFDKAAELGEPAVINASIGTYGGSHDGYDLPSQMINDLITAQNGRTFVCAAGNAGNINFHLGYEAQPDSSFTWFKYSSVQASVFFEWWIGKNDATNFNFSIGADQPSGWSTLGRTKYYNLVSSFNYVNDVATKKDTLFFNSTRIGIITFTAYRYDSTYACDVTINPDLTSYYWRFITNGTGRFDAWNGSSTTGTSDMVSSGLPDDVTFPDIDRYVLPDYNETMVSSFTCSDKVLAVANYINRNEYIDYYGLAQVTSDVVGSLSVNSSLGPSRDGRIKPDISAPGGNTLSAGQFYTLYGLLIYQPYKVAIGGMHNRNGGTSMASPVVAGVAALYLQKNPDASWQEVRDAILLSAQEDSLTGFNLPDNSWGYGKVDAFKALTQTMVYGCTDPSAWNYNPSASLDDGSCFYTGISSVNSNKDFFSCSPNPSNGITRFYFASSKSNSERTIVITDVTGKTVNEIALAPSQAFLSYSSSLPKGIYFCELKQDGTRSQKLKLIVQ